MGRRLLSVVCLVLAVSHDPEGDGCYNNQLLARLCIKVVTQVRRNILLEECATGRVSDLHAARARGRWCCLTSLDLRVMVLTGSTPMTRDCPSCLTQIIEQFDSLPIKKKLNMQVNSGTFVFRGICDEKAEEEGTNRHVTSHTLEHCVLLTSSRQPVVGSVLNRACDTVMRQFQQGRSLYINITTLDKLQADPKLSLLPNSTIAMILLTNIKLSFRFATVIVLCCLHPCTVTIYITFDHVRVSYQVEEKELKNSSDTSRTAEACSQKKTLKPTLRVRSKAATFLIQEFETTYRTLANTFRTVLHNLQRCLYCSYVNVVTIAFHIIISPLYQLFSIFTYKSSSIFLHKQSVNVGISETNDGDFTLNDEKITSAETEHIPHIRHGYLGQFVVTFIVLLMLVFIPQLRNSIFGLKDLSEDHQCGGDHYFGRWFETCFAERCLSKRKSCEDCKISEQGCDGSSYKSSGQTRHNTLWSLSKETTFWKHVRGNFLWKLFRKTHTSTKNSVFQEQLDTWGKHKNIAPLWLTGFHVWPLDRFLPDASRNPEQDMAYLGYRLATLGALPVTCGVSRLKLANAGFYYRGQGDEVVCYSCRARHSGWRSSDDPFAVHRHISPHCSHLAKTIESAPNYHTGEHTSQGHEASGSRSGSEVVGGGGDQTEDGEPGENDTNEAVPNSSFASGPSRTTAVAEAGSHSVTPGGQASRNLFPSSTLDLGGAVYPMYQDMASRRRSFARWDETRAPPLEDILLNGMFYAGYADCVRCFYCGVGLKSWEASDDVWSEHIRWRPNCQYLRTVKGDDYIRRTVTRLNREAESDADAGATITAVRNDNSRAEPPVQQPSTRASVTPGSGPSGSPPTTTTTTASSATPHIIAEQPPTTTAREQPSTSTSAMSSPAERNSDPRNNNSNVPRPPGSGIAVVLPNEESDRERLNRLQQENRELAGRLQCRVCHNHPIDTIFLPCGHLLACDTCTATLRECPQCHEYIQATARVHTG